MGIPDHLTCLLINLYAGQEATVRTGHGKTDWFQISKGVHQGSILSLCSLNLHAEYIRQNAGLDEALAGIKIVGRNINNISPLDCKEIQPVNPKGNRSWIFIGRIDAETETPIVWPPDAKNWLTGKDPDAGKVWRQEEKGMMGWVGWMASPTWWTWVWASFGNWWWAGKPGVLQSMGLQRVGHDWATELNWLAQVGTKLYLNNYKVFLVIKLLGFIFLVPCITC